MGNTWKIADGAMAPKPGSIARLALNLRGTSCARTLNACYTRLPSPGSVCLETLCSPRRQYREMRFMLSATSTRCDQTHCDTIRTNSRLGDCDGSPSPHRSTAAADHWGVSVQLLHLVPQRLQCSAVPCLHVATSF